MDLNDKATVAFLCSYSISILMFLSLNCVSNSTLVTGAKKASVTTIYYFKSLLFYLGDLES